MEIWQNPMTRVIYRKLMAECPRCKSIEYFFDGELKEQTQLELKDVVPVPKEETGPSGLFDRLD